MVNKVTRSPSADSSGIYRRPRLVLKLKRFEDLPTVLSKTKSYPTPIRMIGADYSQTRCVGGDGGTTVDLGQLDKILEFGETFVRAQAGVRVGTLVHALAERGLELPLTPEMGQISLGALAVTTLPQPSYTAGVAQLSSLITELKLITPQGKQMVVTERERDLMRVLRSSYGLLGVVHEVVLRVRPLTPVKIDYQVLSLKEFSGRFSSIINAPGALRLHISPFNDRITVERRTLDESVSLSRSGIWQIRKSVMRNVLPAFGSTVGSVLAAPGLRAAMLSGMQRALRGSNRGVVMYAHEWMRDMPAEAWKARHTYSLWAFAQADYPKVLGEYFSFCRSYYKEHRYRCNVVSGASRLHQDRGSLFSVSYSGPMFTLEPSSTGDSGWDDFLIDFNDFASSLNGTPTFNQTRALQPEHVAKAFGERVKLFRALRQRTDPLNRLRNSYFSYLLG
ncbi:MAG TPA: FAD-binding protein [Steroidobacteraceae bacterium]|jgi:FAD/FMN-containing dehydrogenase|nr:FAD-binding protein [Steroidobacteraceae bacterium]